MALASEVSSPAAEDHLLHDLLRIRLIDPPAHGSARVRSVFGTRPTTPSGTPDLTVTYVDRAQGEGTLALIGRDRSAFDDDDFYVVEHGPDGPALLSLPFDRLRPGLQLRADRSMRALPGLVPIVNLLMLSKGVLPLHGSAFTWNEVGIVAAGWSKGGKTETLLAFTGHGAEAIADEWTYVRPDGSIVGAAEPIRLERAHLAARPELRGSVPRRARARLAAATTATAAHDTVYGRRPNLIGARLAGAIIPALRARQGITVPPGQLFGPTYVASGRLDRLFLLVTTSSGRPAVTETSPSEVVNRMTVAHLHHRLDLVARYYEFRFAFPERRCELLDTIEDVERSLLTEALRDVPCAEVRVPYPPTIDALFETLAPHVGGSS